MRKPELETPFCKALWDALQPVFAQIREAPMPWGLMWKGIEREIPGLFEDLDKDEELQGKIKSYASDFLSKILGQEQEEENAKNHHPAKDR